MATPDRVQFSMRLTREERRRIARLAEREGTSAKKALLRLVDEALADTPEGPYDAPPGSLLDGIEHLVGSVGAEDDPPDLATHPKHMQGFGR